MPWSTSPAPEEQRGSFSVLLARARELSGIMPLSSFIFSVSLNSTSPLRAAAGQKVSFTFTKPGLYDYFDNTKAKWVDADQRVKANTGVPNFPLAMEGTIWVQGHLSGLPSSANNVIPNGKDEFTTDFIAINRNMLMFKCSSTCTNA